MPQPLAFFLTWTTYGTWLHGDPRGAVDDRHNAPKGRPAQLDERRRVHMRSSMKHPPIVLSAEERAVVDHAIREHCKVRSLWLGALNTRTNHVHCVVAQPDSKPEQIAQRLKAWSTRALRRHDPVRFAGSVWTRQASTRYLWTKDNVDKAVQYVLEEQDRPTRWEN